MLGAMTTAVYDTGHRIIATGKTTAANPAVVVATGQTGAGVLVVCNNDAATAVYLGASGVGTSGLKLAAGAMIQIPLAAVEALYVYGSTDVSWMRLGK